ncbi:hypothetical protein [Streptomyces sp. BPSDS2]|uniref:hypothetical protein n=1 Tax=Streptomyces sp. BPSDS2 TaxID=2571021 RepID=UPI0010C24613|nr:hypothetical protein [Streptomyces sp. BPSDS2]
MTTCYADGGAHEYPIEDETGAHCPEHGVTLLWRTDPPADSRPAAHSLEGPQPGGRSPNSDRRSP